MKEKIKKKTSYNDQQDKTDIKEKNREKDSI